MAVIDLSMYRDQTVAVLGLGRSGLAAARALDAAGATVWAWDDGPAARDGAAGQGLETVDLSTRDLGAAALLVLSPGIPLTHPKPHPVVDRARAAGCAVVGDIELLYRAQPQAKFVGITGTNGKSTTTALLGHIAQAAGLDARVGGNLGHPVLAFEPVGAGGLYVLEMSSYQLDLIDSTAFDVAVLLNIAPDHLDRHGGMDGYVAAKRRIFMGQGAGATAVVGVDDRRTRAIRERLAAEGAMRVVPVASERVVAGGVHAVGGHLVDDTDGAARPLLDLRDVPTLPGAHNHQNAAAAFAAARALGLDAQVIVEAIRTYPGLPHRQERVAERRGVLFVNDSKATNPDAAAKALASYDTIYWIAGGRAKDGGLDALLPHLRRVRHAYLIGEAAEAFAAALAGHCPITHSGDLGSAVHAAFDQARADGRAAPVVLLSPACASFDQFTDFEARGDAFRDLVREVAA